MKFSNYFLKFLLEFFHSQILSYSHYSSLCFCELLYILLVYYQYKRFKFDTESVWSVSEKYHDLSDLGFQSLPFMSCQIFVQPKFINFFRYYWEIFMALIFLTTMLYMPLYGINVLNPSTSSWSNTYYHILNGICILDIIINCFTGYHDKNTENVVLNLKQVFK